MLNDRLLSASLCWIKGPKGPMCTSRLELTWGCTSESIPLSHAKIKHSYIRPILNIDDLIMCENPKKAICHFFFVFQPSNSHVTSNFKKSSIWKQLIEHWSNYIKMEQENNKETPGNYLRIKILISYITCMRICSTSVNFKHISKRNICQKIKIFSDPLMRSTNS